MGIEDRLDKESEFVGTREVCYDESSSGGYVAIEANRPGDTIDFGNPPYASHERFGRGGGTLVVSDKIQSGFRGSIDEGDLIQDPTGSINTDAPFGPGSNYRGGQAIIEFKHPSGKVSRVALVRAGVVPVLDDIDCIEDMDATYIVAPDGTVIMERGFTMPPPVTIGKEYPLITYLGGEADGPEVRDPTLRAFTNLGKVTKVIIDVRRVDRSLSKGGPNPFLEPREAIRRFR